MTTMERMPGVRLTSKDLPSFTWNADLVFYDGPLLSLFKTEVGGDVLFVWLDCDERRHRWAIVDVERDTLASYLAEQVSLFDVLKRAGSLLVFDQIGTKRHNVVRTSWKELPPTYLPDTESFLTKDISTIEARRLAEDVTIRYAIKLDGELFIDDLAAIPRLYQQLYSFHYGLAHLDRAAVRAAIARSVKRWTGGFSAVNLFSGLTSVIPSVHRPRIRNLQYASPGHIEMDLLPEMAARIRAASDRLAANDRFASAETLYKDVYRYFRASKISGFEDNSVAKEVLLTDEQIQVLADFVDQFIEILDWSDYRQPLTLLELGPLPQLRALLAYYRRLRRILVYEGKGMVALT